jgi:hypothetical protein
LESVNISNVIIDALPGTNLGARTSTDPLSTSINDTSSVANPSLESLMFLEAFMVPMRLLMLVPPLFFISIAL